MYMVPGLIVLFSIWGHLDCLQILATMNNAAMHVGEHVSFLSMKGLSQCEYQEACELEYIDCVFVETVIHELKTARGDTRVGAES